MFDGTKPRDGEEVLGNMTRVKVVKNKVAPPFKVAEVDIMYGQGISQSGELLDMAADQDIVDKAGAWYSYHGEKIGQGRENAKKYLEEHPDIYNDIQSQVRKAYGIDDESLEEKENPEKIKEQRAKKADAGQEAPAEVAKAAKTEDK